MATSANILTSITTYFNANYTYTPKYFQGQISSPIADSKYAVLNVLSLGAEHAELTGSTTGIEDEGQIRVNCYAKLENGGILEATNIADQVKILFDHILVSGAANVQFETGYIQHVGYNEALQRYEMLYFNNYYGK